MIHIGNMEWRSILKRLKYDNGNKRGEWGATEHNAGQYACGTSDSF